MLYNSFELAKIYQQERLKELKHYRLLKEIQAGEPSLQDRFLSKLGDLLICCGTKLKKQVMVPVNSGKL
jgi:hypothetical protein